MFNFLRLAVTFIVVPLLGGSVTFSGNLSYYTESALAYID